MDRKRETKGDNAVIQIMEKTEMDIHPKIPAGTEWYVHPRSDAVNAEMAVRSNGGDVVCLDTEEGQKDVPVWKTGFDRIQGFINFIQGGRRDIKLDVYRKEPGERLLRFVMRLN